MTAIEKYFCIMLQDLNVNNPILYKDINVRFIKQINSEVICKICVKIYVFLQNISFKQLNYKDIVLNN